MKKADDVPVVHLELNAGVFRIKTDDTIYEITVKADSSVTQVVEKIVEKEVMAEKPPASEPEAAPPVDSSDEPDSTTDTFYKEISEEMYNEIGQLARKLSLNIKMPSQPGEDVQEVDIGKAGADLEEAKGHLQDIITMTEKATMDIMDISEDIRSGCDTIKQNLTDIKKMDFVGKLVEDVTGRSCQEGGAAFLADMIEKEGQLRHRIQELPVQQEQAEKPAPVSDTAPATKKVKIYTFDLDVVFQTLYEMCTNENVKKGHIKPMREEQKEIFDITAVQKAFSDKAPDVDVEENFYNFPLSFILKVLFQYAGNATYKQSLKKMNQSAANIFLDQTLPIEGSIEEKDVPVEPEPKEDPSSLTAGGDSGQLQNVLGLIDTNIALLQTEMDRLGPAESGGDGDTEPGVSKQDHERLIGALESTDTVIQKIIANISRILESLTFQDLSGQRIKKIVSVLSTVQIQLLSLLVAVGAKLKKKEEEKDISTRETEEIACKEVDEKLALLVSEEGEGDDEFAGGPLDQDAVDNLLAELGF